MYNFASGIDLCRGGQNLSRELFLLRLSCRKTRNSSADCLLILAEKFLLRLEQYLFWPESICTMRLCEEGLSVISVDFNNQGIFFETVVVRKLLSTLHEPWNL